MSLIDYSNIYSDAAFEIHQAEAKARIARAQCDYLKLYKVYADYRPNNKSRYPYYIFAKTKAGARKRFAEFVNWLKIYSVEECCEEETQRIISKYAGNTTHIFI